LIKSITKISKQTILFAIEQKKWELAERLNFLSGGLITDHEFKMFKLNSDPKVPKDVKIKESILINGIVDIDKLISTDDYDLYHELIQYPASIYEKAFLLFQENKLDELLE